MKNQPTPVPQKERNVRGKHNTGIPRMFEERAHRNDRHHTFVEVNG